MTLNVDDVLRRWAALGSDLHRLLGGIGNDAEYDEAAGLLEAIDRLTEGGVAGPHVVLASLLAKRLVAYDERHYPPVTASPAEVLAFLMDQHGLQQADLADVADQGTISRVLSGKREVGKKLAGRVAQRFGVDPAMFLNTA